MESKKELMMTMIIERCEGKKLKEKPGTKRQREHKKKNSDAQLDCTTPGAYDRSSPPGCHSDQLVLYSNGRGGARWRPNDDEPKCSGRSLVWPWAVSFGPISTANMR